MDTDIHQDGDAYTVRSVYFDDIDNSCMDENEAGIDHRKKFRIRTYDPAAETMRLEIKEKQNGFTRKTSCTISRSECEALLRGRRIPGFDSRAPLNALRLASARNLMRPAAVVSYQRTAFVCPAGNVRITFDRNITVNRHTDMFLRDTMPFGMPLLPPGLHILEVKYDEFLPDHIASLLELGELRQTAFSKYYLGRLTLMGSAPRMR